VLVGALLFASVRFGGPVPGLAISELALLSVSAQTTAGFSTFSPAQLPEAGQVIVILSMIVGGSQGSTAGGVKLLRVLIVLRLVHWMIAQTRLPPHAVSGPTLSGERLTETECLRAAALILLFLAVLGVSWLCFLGYGYPPLQGLFEVASATGTVGLSAGIARPELEPALKVILCVDMLLGRLEVFAVLVALSPRTWVGRRAS
jgi:trk system potassium uptake protein TrkH